MSIKLLRYALRGLSLQRQMSTSFYAVARGHKVGIYDSWSKCEPQVKGFKGAKYKKFPTHAEAETFIKELTGGDGSVGIRFSPKDVAVAMGKKTATAEWKQDMEVNQKQQETVQEAEDYWPASDGDSYDEDAITEKELLAALAKAEDKGCTKATVSTSSNSNTKTKRKQPSSASSSKTKRPKHTSKVWEAVGQKCIGCHEFAVDVEDFVIVYTDGSCINNGQANASAGFGVYFGEEHSLNAAKPVRGRVTNNVGEIQAAIYAIKVAKDVGIPKLCISTDSQFLINAITAWIFAWKRNQWCLKNGEPVKNAVDFKELDSLLQDDTLLVKWNYVKAHKGIKGNEMADKLARAGSDIYKRLNAK